MVDAALRGEQWALVLAGGDGKRLQALTEAITGAPIPKQYCRIVGERSLLESTLARTGHLVPRDRTLVIINHDHLDIAREQLSTLPARSVLVQPRNCDTGPGLLYSLRHLARRSPDATIAVFPSDHYVGDDHGFVGHVRRATEIVQQLPHKIILLGIPPDHCAPGYGYVEPGAPLGSAAGAGAFHVAGFQEKPTMSRARAILARGGLWNSFVMVFRLRRLLELVREVLPAEYAEMRALPADPMAAAAHYRTLRPWNFSTTFLARIPEHLIVLRVDNVAWSDWGTPQA
ncbi:MAG: sugar phosphate nucleotidyltransferase, partial [Gaiellaceae bacterium]